MIKFLVACLSVNIIGAIIAQNYKNYNTNQSLVMLYQSKPGWLIRKIIAHNKWVSKLAGLYCDLPISKRHIAPFIKKHNISMDESEKKIDEFNNFNEFFTRTLRPEARPIDLNPTHIISPADGKIMVIEHIQEQSHFPVKNISFSLESFLKNKALADHYIGGTLILIRLDPWDYHRFHMPVDGSVSKTVHINGKYESVNPIVYHNNIQVLTENERHLMTIKTNDFDDILMVSVGALCVGKIIETYQPNQSYCKGNELGYFAFGGSTIVLLFKKDVITVHEEIKRNSELYIETPIKMGNCFAMKRSPV